MRDAHERGYRITHQDDYAQVFGGMHGVPEFERLWKAMGGETP